MASKNETDPDYITTTYGPEVSQFFRLPGDSAYLSEFEPNEAIKKALNEFILEKSYEINDVLWYPFGSKKPALAVKLEKYLVKHYDFKFHVETAPLQILPFLFQTKNLKEPNLDILKECVEEITIDAEDSLIKLQECLQTGLQENEKTLKNSEIIVKEISNSKTGSFNEQLLRPLLDKTADIDKPGVLKLLRRYNLDVDKADIAKFIPILSDVYTDFKPTALKLRKAVNRYRNLKEQFQSTERDLQLSDFQRFIALLIYANINDEKVHEIQEDLNSFKKTDMNDFLTGFNGLQLAQPDNSSFFENFETELAKFKQERVLQLEEEKAQAPLEEEEKVPLEEEEEKGKSKDLLLDENMESMPLDQITEPKGKFKRDVIEKILKKIPLTEKLIFIERLAGLQRSIKMAAFLNCWFRLYDKDQIMDSTLEKALEKFKLIKDNFFGNLYSTLPEPLFAYFAAVLILEDVSNSKIVDYATELKAFTQLQFKNFLEFFVNSHKSEKIDDINDLISESIEFAKNPTEHIKKARVKKEEEPTKETSKGSGIVRGLKLAATGAVVAAAAAGPVETIGFIQDSVRLLSDLGVSAMDVLGAAKTAGSVLKEAGSGGLQVLESLPTEFQGVAESIAGALPQTAEAAKALTGTASFFGYPDAFSGAAEPILTSLPNVAKATTGAVEAASGTFAGAMEAASGTIAGALQTARDAASGTFTGIGSAFKALAETPVYRSIQEGPIGQTLSAAFQIATDNPAASAAVASVVLLSIAYAYRRRQRSKALASKVAAEGENAGAVSWFIKGVPMDETFLAHVSQVIATGENVSRDLFVKTAESLLLPAQCDIPRALLKDEVATQRYVGEWALATLHEHGFAGWNIEEVQTKNGQWMIMLTSSHNLQSYQLSNVLRKYAQVNVRKLGDNVFPKNFKPGKAKFVELVKSLTQSFGQAALELQLYKSTSQECTKIQAPLQRPEAVASPVRPDLQVKLVNVLLTIPPMCFAEYYPLVEMPSVNLTLPVYYSNKDASDADILAMLNYLLSKDALCNARAEQVITDGGIKAVKIVPLADLVVDTAEDDENPIKRGISTCSKQKRVYSLFLDGISEVLNVSTTFLSLNTLNSTLYQYGTKATRLSIASGVSETVSLEGLARV